MHMHVHKVIVVLHCKSLPLEYRMVMMRVIHLESMLTIPCAQASLRFPIKHIPLLIPLNYLTNPLQKHNLRWPNCLWQPIDTV